MLDKKLVEKVIDKALSNGADFAEIFVEDTYNSRIQFNDGKTKQNVIGKDYGAGVRVFYGETAIYAYTNDLSEKSLLSAAEAVSKAAKGNNIIKPIDLTKMEFENIHPISIPNNTVAKSDKIDFMRKVNAASRNYNDNISQVDINFTERIQKVMIANSEGLWAEDSRNYTRVGVTSIASSGNEKQSAGVGPGGHIGYEFINSLNPVELGEQTAKIAAIMLKADYAPSGKFPVVIDNGFGGVIFHEACGHSLETTAIAKGASVFCGKMDQQIANPVVTALDDGTLPNAWGSENIDDEGMPTQKTILIQDGILKSYMVDKMGSIKTGYARTGSGRRQSYKFAPASRMRNTYIANGTNKLEDIISSVDYGIYAKKMGGGSVMPGTGNFNFAVSEGYIIRNGKIAEPVRGATLIGNGADALMKISMIGNNLEQAQGMCGSVSGSIPTNVGQPAIKIDEILVGGRK
ncbi:MAG: TldD/PmbA family protein [Candidatus Cloacimonadota bacterium]|nr:MAG: TldD/PmbA family protein [Candidatus Cloacimonadota bacterium]RLC53300.1 MAG: TldD/PmbA family protein [Candidatus Cloacimonadota bacterium]